MSQQQPRPCPTCKKPAGVPPENRWYPFCSNRCKTIDLGRWLSDEYRIPVKSADTGEVAREGNDDGDTLH